MRGGKPAPRLVRNRRLRPGLASRSRPPPSPRSSPERQLALPGSPHCDLEYRDLRTLSSKTMNNAHQNAVSFRPRSRVRPRRSRRAKPRPSPADPARSRPGPHLATARPPEPRVLSDARCAPYVNCLRRPRSPPERALPSFHGLGSPSSPSVLPPARTRRPAGVVRLAGKRANRSSPSISHTDVAAFDPNLPRARRNVGSASTDSPINSVERATSWRRRAPDGERAPGSLCWRLSGALGGFDFSAADCICWMRDAGLCETPVRAPFATRIS